jgi:hypothetical protein
MAGRRKKTDDSQSDAVTDPVDPQPVTLPKPESDASEREDSARDMSTDADIPAVDQAPVPPAEATPTEPAAPLAATEPPATETAADPAPTESPEPSPASEPAAEPPEPAQAEAFQPSPAPERATDPAPEAAPPWVVAPPPPRPPPPARRNPLLPVLGGAVAAFLGFVLAQAVPQGWPLEVTTQQLSAFEQRLAEQDRKLAALTAPDPGLADRLAALEQRLDTLPAAGADPAALDALRAEIATLRDAAPPAPDLSPLQAELAALKAELAAIPRESGVAQELEAMKAAAEAERAAAEARAEALRAEAESMRAGAEAAARAAIGQGVVLRVQAALDTGGPFDVALTDLGTAGITVPPDLAAHATGVPTLAELQAGFADAARAALAATMKPEEGAGLADRVTGFLKAQTGLRSTAPREGDTPDAVLSRAEAALRGGDLPATLAELDTLPPEATAALAGWRALADTRAAAAAALAALAQDLTAK